MNLSTKATSLPGCSVIAGNKKTTQQRKPVLFMRWLFALMLFVATGANAQVTVTATGGVLGPTGYTTLKLAFDAINAGTHTGSVTVSIFANTTEGATPATLNSSGAGSASYTAVLISPTADGVSVSGNPVTGFGVIQLNGADNVTIDGDNAGSGGINRNLTVNNTTATATIANSAIRIATSAAVISADNNTIKNCILNGNVTGGNSSLITSTSGSSNSSFGIYCGGNGGATATGAPTAITSVTTNVAPTGTTINALVINNNAINQCARGIVFNGNAAAQSTGVTITNNTIGATASLGSYPFTTPTTTVYTKGIWIAGTNAITITGNTVQNILSFIGTIISGIELNTAIGTGTISISNNTVSGIALNVAGSNAVRGINIVQAGGPYSISGNTITNVQSSCNSATITNQPNAIFVATTATSATIEGNKISTVVDRNSGTFGVAGVFFNGGNNITFRNNFVSDINQDMSGGSAFSTSFGVMGVRIAAGTGHKIYHNSFSLFGSLIGTAATSQLTACLVIASSTSTGMDVRNNIFSNVMTGGSTSIAHVGVFLPSGATSAMNLTWNNNAYYSGPTAASQGIAQVGTTAGTTFYLASGFVPGSTAGAGNFRNYTSTLLAANTNNDNASYASTAAAPFTSTTDLHLNLASSEIPNVEQKGATGTGVATDIDGDARPNGATTFPDMGADEVATAICSSATGGTITPAIVAKCVGQTYTMSTSGATTGTGITYQWEVSATGGGAGFSDVVGGSGAVTTSYTTPVLSVGVQYYRLRVTCSAGPIIGYSTELALTTNALPTITITPTPANARICGTGSVSLAASGGVSYSWSPTTTPATGSPVTASPTVTTLYTVTGTDANTCSNTATQTVTVGPAITVNTTTATPATICTGSTSVLNATASASPALSYTVASIPVSVETPSGSPVVLATGGVATPAAQSTQSTPLDDGYWDGIALPFSFTYYGVSYNTVRIGTNGNVQFGAIAATTGNPGNASWTSQTIPTAGGNLDNFIGGPWIDQDLSTTPFGTTRYFTNGTAPNRKFVVSFEAVHVFSSADNNTSQIILNENGTIDVLLLGGGLTSTAVKAIGIENVGGTQGVAAPGRNSGTWTTLADEAWRFTPPTLNYSWAPATGLTPSATVVNPTTPALTSTTNYVVTVTEPVSGCSGTGNVTVTVNQNSTISLSSAVGTDNQSVSTNTAIADITYAIGGGGTGASLTAGSFPTGVTGSYLGGIFTISGTPSVNGVFNYTITTTGPCTNNSLSGTITVTANNGTISLSSAAGTDAQTVCANVAITPITYAIGGGATGAVISAGALPAGVTGSYSGGVFTIIGTPTASGVFNYTVSTTGPGVNPSLSGSITVNPNSTIALTSAVGTNNQTVCANATITSITYAVGGGATGASLTSGSFPPGITGSYSGGVYTISGTATGSGSFLYTITTSGGGCTQAVASGAITVNGVLGATFTKTNLSACSGTPDGTITVSPSGGSGSYTYSWTGNTGSGNPAPQNFSAGNVNPLTNLNYGYYNVTITDAGGCGSTMINQIHVEFAFTVQVTYSGTSASACGNTGSVLLYGNSGIQPYTYSLNGVTYQAGNSFTGLAAGSYTGYVKDAGGCVGTKSITVSAAAAVTVNPFVRNASSCAPDGSIEVYRTGGTPPYTYSKNGGATYQASNLFSGLAAGSYSIWVKDAAGCTGNATANVAAGTGLTVTTSKVNTSSCIADGSIQVTATGGVAPYTYSKNNGVTFQASNSFANLGGGNYAIVVKDSKGCLGGPNNVTINVNTITVTSSATNASSCASTNGKVQLFRTGGTGPYMYSLDGNTYQSGSLFSNLAPGTYDGYVQDSKGCIGVQNGIVVGPSCPRPGITTKGNENGNDVKVMSTALKVQAYPNPTATSFTLKLEGFSSDKITITVTDIMGRNVYQATGSGTKQYSFGDKLMAGIYNVQVVQGDKKQTVKLIKE